MTTKKNTSKKTADNPSAGLRKRSEDDQSQRRKSAPGTKPAASRTSVRPRKTAKPAAASVTPADTVSKASETPRTRKPTARRTSTKAKPAAVPVVPAAEPAKPAPAAKPASKPGVPSKPAAAPVVPAAEPAKPAPAAKPASKPEVPSKPVAVPVVPAAEPAKPAPAVPRITVELKDGLTPQEIGALIGRNVAAVITALMRLGSIVSANQKITDPDTISLVLHELGYEAEIVTTAPVVTTPEKVVQQAVVDEEVPTVVRMQLRPPDQVPDSWVRRTPVVTVMGHVDHGKTTLLDTIKKSNVVDTEFGQITQHIGAYRVQTPHGAVTFLDTPGHEAFSSLRIRGAGITDIIILVVAGTEGVMPQTVEAISHAKAAGVPVIVAVNKSDLPEFSLERVKQQMSDHGFVASDWGGQTEFVPISARNNVGIDQLLDAVLLQAEVMNLRAPVDGPAEAAVIETRKDPQRGSLATVIVVKGVLRVGNSFVCGSSAGKVRAITSHTGERLTEVRPGDPGEVMGFACLPQAGDMLRVVADDREARRVAEERLLREREETRSRKPKLSFEDILSGQSKAFGVILKTDTQGSLEAIRKMLNRVTAELGARADLPRLNIVHAAVGEINESDVLLATAGNSVIIGFNIRPTTQAIKEARHRNVEIKTYRIIYELVDDLRRVVLGQAVLADREEFLGRALVRKVFSISKVGQVAGCFVEEGRIVRNARCRLLRDNVIIAEARISSLKRFKEDVREVEKGYECGIMLENVTDIKEGDVFESYQVVKSSGESAPA